MLVADAILSTNYSNFTILLAGRDPKHNDLPNDFIASIIDRFIQVHPPNFDQQAQHDLIVAISIRYQESVPPASVYSALYLLTLIENHYPIVINMQRTGSQFTSTKEDCRDYLRSLGQHTTSEDQVAAALLYASISQHPRFSPSTLVTALQAVVPPSFGWHHVVANFDKPDLRVTKDQFLALYQALRPIAESGGLDIQQMWGGNWEHSETQLSFLGAFASLSPTQLDATTIPGLETTFTQDDFADADAEVQARAKVAVRHPLVSYTALQAMFNVALKDPIASDTPEAKRLFQDVVVPNLDIFLVSSAAVPKPWSDLATDTMQNLFGRFINKYDPNYNFVLAGLWRKGRLYVKQQLIELHAKEPLSLPTILDHALKHGWLDELVSSMLSGFTLDLAALAHARGVLDLHQWAQSYAAHRKELAQALITFLDIKAAHEMDWQRNGESRSVMLPVKTVFALLGILDTLFPKPPSPNLISVHRQCITVYPRLINYGEGYDDIIDASGTESNQLPLSANEVMEQHYKRMYSQDLEVRQVVEKLNEFKHSKDASNQDVFACMIHGLFDEYTLYSTYPLEALATTAVLFGGIISSRLISNLPLDIGLGMILEAVRDHSIDQPMYKFGLQALMQLFPRLREWPLFCSQLLQVPQLQGTEAWRKAEDVVRDHQEELARTEHEDHRTINGAFSNGDLGLEPSLPSFTSLHIDASPYEYDDEPQTSVREKIQFELNNITAENLMSKFEELRVVMDDQSQSWFAGHLVEQRAKTQPNYHSLYLNLVKLFESKSLWAEVLRETYVATFRTLNAESTMQSAVERTHLKNLGVWLGSLTLARDKPIKHRNIAFKQLLMEAYDTQRLIVVIPFVCKVLAQGKHSSVFKPPNPWIMDIVQLLIELYHHAELKLNQRFEIEVLCGELDLDHKSIEPSNDLMNRTPLVEEGGEVMTADLMERMESMGMNGIGGVNTGRFSPQEIVSSIPDLGPLLVYPPGNDMVNQIKLQEIVRTAITRAVHEIISPVVERSVTIAAISTAQIIHKDFATEPSEARVRGAAINMVKKTAGSLALVTSKEPLRASMTNYIRTLAMELPQSLPEGTIIMCVNSNLELACSQVEKKAEERAVPEIEEMLEPELEARRLHRLSRPDEPYVDPSLSRWSWTIPNPYKLQPSTNGLNQDQMSIYDEFAKQPRPPAMISAHGGSQGENTRSISNEMLQEPYATVPNLATSAETPTMPLLNNQHASLPLNAGVAGGRHGQQTIDPRGLVDRVTRILAELQRLASEADEQHYSDLPRPHAVLDHMDHLLSWIIKCAQIPDGYELYIIDQICNTLFSGLDDNLTIECLINSLQSICGIGVRTANRVVMNIAHIEGEKLLNLPLALALQRAEMIDWHRIDSAIAKGLAARQEESLDFFASIIDNALVNDHPIALFADFAKSLELAWQWIDEDPSLEIGQELKQKLTGSGGLPPTERTGDEKSIARQSQMEYVFQEWVGLYDNPNASPKALPNLLNQMYKKQVINDKDDLCLFVRSALEFSVTAFEHYRQGGTLGDPYAPVDALSKLVVMLVSARVADGEVPTEKAGYLRMILSLVVLILNHHHITRGERFNQRVFYRFFSRVLSEFNEPSVELTITERQSIILNIAEQMLSMRPSYFPGFIFAWISLIGHRDFLPHLMALPDQAGWAPVADILDHLMASVGEQLKAVLITPVAKDIYRGVVKLLVVLQHDFPNFVAANHARLAANIPSHCIQLHNLILNANPAPFASIPDPLQPGLKADRIEEMRDLPEIMDDVEEPLRKSGLFDILEQALRTRPSEDAVAHIAHAIQLPATAKAQSGFAHVPINVDKALINSLVVYIGMNAIARANQSGSATFVTTSADAALVSMLVHELRPEARYFLINSMVDQLRYPNALTHYFSQALLEIFGTDLNDQEESDIRQQITRVLLERLLGQWPQPWGLVLTIHELVKNEKYKFFELPFVQALPEVSTFSIHDWKQN